MAEGLLSANIMHFARLLRRAGIPVGPAGMLAAQQAMTLVEIGSRAQVHAVLRAAMIRRHEHQELFDQAFAAFWRDPEAGRAAEALGLTEAQKGPPEKAPPGSRRLAEAFDKHADPNDRPPPPRREVDAVLTVSEREQLQQMDFEAMSAAEIARAKAEIRTLRLPLDLRRTRRERPDPRGPHADLAATIRAARRYGGEILALEHSRRVTRPPPLVVLCDISGSMTRYAQILLHFLHAVANDRERVSTFLFGTRLTNITRQLRHRDPEVAFEMVAHAVPDWSGGTRIGEALADFNRHWARRVLGQGAVMLLVTDGLDRPREAKPGETPDPGGDLAENMERLHKSCRRLIWLNPLLRWDGFEPKSQGIRAMLPHVDEFRPVHNLASLRALVDTLSRPSSPRQMEQWRLAS
jgi:uncharacterized protein with von Willebrand factor type A (vWA) domain